VRFVDGQVLSAADLNAEQQDQIARLRRHAIGAHTWGIVKGGELTVSADGAVGVEPAFAYDGYARELVLAEPRALPAAERFELLNTDVLDVWLVYRRDAVDAPLEEPSCDNADRAGRWQETPLVRFTAAAGGPPDARRPPGVPQGDIPFPPSRMPPDDPTLEWPVFLGRIHRTPGPSPGEYVYRADATGRPYIGARAKTIEPPWSGTGGTGGTRLDLAPAPGQALELSDGTSAANPLVAVSDAGDLRLGGDATVAGELTVRGGRLTLDAGPPAAAAAWRIYHLAAQGPAPEELRIEVGDPTGRVVVGSWSAAKNAFVPHLTIEGSGAVTVDGDLRVTGDMDVQGILDADFQTARKAYRDGLAALPLSAAQAQQRTTILNNDTLLATALGWP
jgi:hypothetical protein